MEEAMAWQVDPDTLHVAQTGEGEWKVLREGAPTAESRHGSKYEALDAARELARRRSAKRIKVHDRDGKVAKTVEV